MYEVQQYVNKRYRIVGKPRKDLTVACDVYRATVFGVKDAPATRLINTKTKKVLLSNR